MAEKEGQVGVASTGAYLVVLPRGRSWIGNWRPSDGYMLMACRGPAHMDAPGGPRCSCGWPSRHESGWCGRPNVMDTLCRVQIIFDELGYNDDPERGMRPHLKTVVLKAPLYKELLAELNYREEVIPKSFKFGAMTVALGK